MNGGAAAQEAEPERGVYEAPFKVGGYDALVAIDSRGNACKVAKLRPGARYDDVKRRLERELDRIDPVFVPRLVRDHLKHPPAAPHRRAPQLHPAHANDFRAYRRRLFEQLSRRIHVFPD